MATQKQFDAGEIEALERWCDETAKSVVAELLTAKVIPEDKADWTCKIVSQELFIKLVSGRKSPDITF